MSTRVPDMALNQPWQAQRIPAVRSWMHNCGYPVVVVVPTGDNDFIKVMMPTDADVLILSSYQDYRLPRIYNDYAIERACQRAPFYIFDDVNTHTFMKSARTKAWQYHVMTWQQGPVPRASEEKQYSTLVELIDYIERDGAGRWQQWKVDHPEVFSPM